MDKYGFIDSVCVFYHGQTANRQT